MTDFSTEKAPHDKEGPRYGLKRLHLHNAHVHNKSFVLNVDGHTNIQGENGSGKTSLLTLIPVFYGAIPSQVVEKDANKSDFVSYFLHSASSFIAYEYSRFGTDVTVLMYRSSELLGKAKTHYQFFAGGFDQTIYAEDVEALRLKGESVRDIIKAIKDLGVPASNQIVDLWRYKAILENDVNEIRKRNNDPALISAAKQYCMGDSKTKTHHLEKMAASILKRANPFERLHEMVADTAFADIEVANIKVPGTGNIESAKMRIEGIRDITDMQPRLEKANALIAQLQQAKESIHSRGQSINWILKNTQKALASHESLHVNLKAEKSGLDAKYDEEKREAKNNLAQNNDRLSAIDIQISNYINKRDQFTDIAIKRAEYNSLSEMRRNVIQLEEEYQDLTATVQGYHGEMESKIVKLEKSNAQANDRIKRIIETKREEQHTIDRDANQRNQDAYVTYQANLDELDGGHIDQQIAVINEQLITQNQLAIAIGISEEDQLESDKRQFTVDEAHARISNLYDALKAPNESKKEISARIEKTIGLIEEKTREKERLKHQLARVESLEKPNSLLSMLNKISGDQWQDSLGKVLPESFYQRTDLKPVLDANTGSGETVFGWTFDLEVLSTNSTVRQAATLHEQRDQIEEALESLKVTFESLNAELNQDRKALRNEEGVLQVIQQKIDTARDDLKLAQDSLAMFVIEAKARVSKRKEEAENLAKALQSELVAQREAKKQKKAEYRKQYTELKNQYAADAADKKQAVEEEIETYNNELSSLAVSLKSSIAAIKLQFDEECIKNGVPANILGEKRQNIEALKTKINRIVGFKSALDDYDDFVKTRTPLYERQLVEEAEVKNAISALNTEMEASRLNYARMSEDLSNKLNDCKSAIRNQKSVIEDLAGIIQKMTHLFGSVIHGEMETDESYDALATKLQRDIERAKSLSDETSSICGKLCSELDRFTDGEWSDDWTRFKAECVNVDAYTDDFYHLIIPKMHHQVSNTIDIRRQNVRESFELTFEGVRLVYDGLNRINKEVGQVARKIAAKVNTNQRIANLSNIEIHIRTKTEQSECWPILTSFMESWALWSTKSEHDVSAIPPASLISQMLEAYRKLENEPFYRKNEVSMIDLISIEIGITENGTPRTINSSREFNNISSNGLSMLALIVVFVGISRYLCSSEALNLHWSIDEVGAIDNHNMIRLLKMLTDSNISIVSALPNANKHILNAMQNSYQAKKGIGVLSVVSSTTQNVGMGG
ncbi:hypothetical protein A8139_11210 [Marinomonas primoryensis]|uniref:ATP-binding protein n=1 Tax=Marinomonas primoryensis TaxID=178399 RepID=A0A2Z4PSH0_9GAMM|nr:ATP-binding protein [Marinomonas primoryensis]AWY00496.1 hypothetical protein A8139_11210 [Marinomonas primoryensis]